jgi:hypothetical protein
MAKTFHQPSSTTNVYNERTTGATIISLFGEDVSTKWSNYGIALFSILLPFPFHRYTLEIRDQGNKIDNLNGHNNNSCLMEHHVQQAGSIKRKGISISI